MSQQHIGDNEKRRVLFTAVRLNRADVIKAVATGIAEGYNEGTAEVNVDLLNCLDETQHFTALHAAVQGGAIDALRMLLRLGAYVRIKNAAGQTAVQLAFLSTKFVDAQQVFITEAVQCIAASDTEQLERLLEAGLPSDALFGDAQSLKAWAEQVDNAAAVNLLAQYASNTAAAEETSPHVGKTTTAGEQNGVSSPESTDEAVLQQQHALDADINECRQSIAAMMDEQQRVLAELSSRGTDGVLRLLRETQQAVTVAYAALEEHDTELQQCLDEIVQCRRKNEQLQRDIQTARATRNSISSSSSSSNSTNTGYSRGSRVLYVKDDCRAAAEVVKVHAEDPEDLYYTVRLLETGQEKNTTAKYLQAATATTESSSEQAASDTNGTDNAASTLTAAVAAAAAAPKRRVSTADRYIEERQSLLAQLLQMAGDVEDELHSARALRRGSASAVVQRISRMKAEAAETAAAASEKEHAVHVASRQLAALQEHSQQLAALLQDERALADQPLSLTLPLGHEALQPPQQQQAARRSRHNSNSSSGGGAVTGIRRAAGGSIIVSPYDGESLQAALAYRAEQQSEDQGLWQSLLSMLFGTDTDADAADFNPIIQA